MKMSKQEMIRVAMIAILYCMVCSCKTQHKATKEITVDETSRSFMTETATVKSMEDMKRLLREKENWHIVWYTEPDTVTGKPVIAAEAWASKETESLEDKTTTEVTTEERNEENEQLRHEEEKKESETSMKTGLEWWQTLDMAVGAMMVMLMGWMVKRGVDGKLRGS